MRRIIYLFVLLPSVCFGLTNTAVSVLQSDVNNAINGGGGFTALSDGDTCILPAGIQTWTTGVNVTKAITIVGAGSGRVIAVDDMNETLTVGTGTLTMIVPAGNFSPGFSGSTFTTGLTVQIFQDNHINNWMQGTVTSWNSGTNQLTLNITSTNGSGSGKRWLITTLPLTTIVNGLTAANTSCFKVTESSAGHVNISGIRFTYGGATTGLNGAFITLNQSSGGHAVLVHDCYFEATFGGPEHIDSNTNRGVIWNCSFVYSSNSDGHIHTGGSIRIKGNNLVSSWTTASTWGNLDTTGEGALYVEGNDFHVTNSASDNDDGGRMVWRYNVMDHATAATHGADTSTIGGRYLEYYNNTCLFKGYGNGTTFNISNGWVGIVRGGTYVVHDNIMPRINSSDYPNKAMMLMTVMNLQRNGGPNACWGAGTSGGAKYPAPRQVGMGYVTGTGTDGSGRTNDSVTYVGDSEPGYVWANTDGVSNQPLLNTNLTDFGGTGCTAPDHTSNYIHNGRDYWNIGTDVSAGSSGTTINVVSTAPSGINFPTSGTLSIYNGSGYTLTPYTGVSGNSFTGCTNIPTLTVGNSVGLAKPSYTPYTYPHTFAGASAPTVISPLSVNIAVNQILSQTFTSNGSPAPTWTHSTLPSWINFADNGDGTCTLSGTSPGSTEVDTPTLTATNASGNVTKTITITVTSSATYSLSVSTTGIDLGSVFSGRAVGGIVYVTNTGTAQLDSVRAYIQGTSYPNMPQYVSYIVPGLGSTIRVGATNQFIFTYLPLAPNTLNSTIEIKCLFQPQAVGAFTLKGVGVKQPKTKAQGRNSVLIHQ
jgi:hypothetical protein